MAKYPNVDAGIKWAKAILSGKVPACEYVRLACQRHFDDLEKSKDKTWPYKFDPDKAEKKLKFIQLLPHVKGPWAFERKLITLEPWQKFGLAMTFGWVKKKTGLRRFRESYWEVARKNGKSVIAAGVAISMFCADGEFGAEVYSGATTEKQAWEVFRPARLMVNRSPMLIEAAGIEVNASNMNRPEDGSRFEPLIGNPGDGQSPSCAVIDEYHEHQTADLYYTMDTGMGARTQPLKLVITTAGDNIAGPCYELRSKVIETLTKVNVDEELFCWIFTIDPEDDWTDPKVLAKANPNIDISVYRDYLESQQQKAIKSTAFQNTFKTKHLNVWVFAMAGYFNMQLWQNCYDPDLSIEDFEGEECLIILDLASKTDIAASVKLFYRVINEQIHYYALAPRFYLPSETIQYGDERDVVKRYQDWVNAGYLTEHDGAEVDFNLIRDDVFEDAQKYSLVEVPHDEWGAFQIARDIEAQGYQTVKIPKNTKNFSPPMKELDAAIRSGRFHHDGNPILTWMVGNVVAKEDANGNVYPRKEKNSKKIDGCVCVLMGINRVMLLAPTFNQYDFLENPVMVGI